MAYNHPQLSDNPHDANYWLRRREQDRAKAEADKRREQAASGKKPKINRTCRIRISGKGLPLTTIYCSSQVVSKIKDLTVMVRQNIHVPGRGKNAELVKMLVQLADKESDLHEHFTGPGRAVIAAYAATL